MEQRGIRTDRGDVNRATKHYDSQVLDLDKVRGRIEAMKVEVNNDLLAFVLTQRELAPAQAEPSAQGSRANGGANEPTKIASVSLERIKAEWQAEKAKQGCLIANRAQNVHARKKATHEQFLTA